MQILKQINKGINEIEYFYKTECMEVWDLAFILKNILEVLKFIRVSEVSLF
jgi:hypothetical protein